MSKYILFDGDIVMFEPNFTPAVVTVIPGKLQASGTASLSSKKMCLQGDEKQVQVAGCGYICQNFNVPGTGTLTIEALGPDQVSTKINNNKAILLQGSNFVAKFTVQVPAQDVSSSVPVPDPVAVYVGQGKFITTNTKWTAT
jgi:hypothetical protein